MTTYRSEAASVTLENTADRGVEGNSRLTSTTGLLLILMLAVEGVTIVSIRGLISWHIFVGIALIGPALLKSASTLFRFVHYYRGDSAYVRKGPPHPILRISGPFVMLTTVAVLGTGVGLLIVHPGEGGLMLTAHKASFILWIGLMSIHVLGHIFEAVTASWRDLRPEPGDPAARRRFVRTGAVLASLVIGVGAAAVVTPTATAWTHRHFRSEEGRG